MKLLALLLTAAIYQTAYAQYDVLNLEFNDPRFPQPNEQGLTIGRPLPEKIEVVNGCLKIQSGQQIKLRTIYGRLSRYQINDLGRFQIRLANRSGNEAVLRVELQPFDQLKSVFFWTFSLGPGDAMHEYSADLDELASYRGKRPGCYLNISIISKLPGKPIAVDIDRISLFFSKSALDRHFLIIGKEKLSFFDETIKAMRIYGLPVNDLELSRKRLERFLTPEKREKFIEEYKALYQKIQAGRSELRKLRGLSPLKDGWQRGASFLSFGLNGYLQDQTFDTIVLKSSRNQLNRAFFTNADGTRSGLRICPDRAKVVKTCEDPDFVSWCGQSRSWLYQHESGKMIDWKLLESRIAPGVVLSTDADSVHFSPTAGGNADLKAVYAIIKGKKEILTEGTIAGDDLSENFLLIVSGNDVPAVPWLVTFQKRPKRILVKKGKVIVQDFFRTKSFGISCLYGARPLERGWRDQSHRVWAQCRLLNNIMNAMPYDCEEYFKVDRARNEVSVRNVFRYYEMDNEWKTPALRIAPLPPVLALAGEAGYPISVQEKLTDSHCNTVYGKYLFGKGNELIYTLPLPALTDDLFLGTDRWPQRTEWMNRMPDFIQYSGYYGNNDPRLNTWAQVLESWCSLSTENKKRISTVVRALIEWYARQIRDAAQIGLINTSHIFAERTEPYSGISYCTYGWKSVTRGVTILHDTTDLTGFELNGIARYAQVSGDWAILRKHYDMLRKIYSGIPCRMEWATMAVASSDRWLCHHIDMATDTYVASEAMEKIARGVGDQQTADLALYILAKETIPITNTFRKRRYDMSVNNNWDWNRNLPELGYINCGGIIPHKWDNPYLATSFLFGCAYSGGLIRLYRDFCKDEVARYEFEELKRYYPQWADPLYRLPGQKRSKNGPAPLARHLMIRDMLGEDTEKLAKILAAGTFENTKQSIWSMVEQPSFVPMLHSVAGSMIVGREAPVKLLNWYPAEILDAKFNFSDSRAVLKFRNSQAFELMLWSRRKPDEVKMDGVPINNYRYDMASKHLILKSGKNSCIELVYRGYTVPEFKRHIPPKEESMLTKEMRICRNEFLARSGNIQFESEKKLDLTDFFNMELTGVPVRKFAGVNFNVFAKNGIIKAIKLGKNRQTRIFQGRESCRNIQLLFSAPAGVKIDVRLDYADGSISRPTLRRRNQLNESYLFISLDSKRYLEVDGVVSESQKELIPVTAITVTSDQDIAVIAATATK